MHKLYQPLHLVFAILVVFPFVSLNADDIIQCTSDDTLTIQSFYEITREEASVYLPNVKRFDQNQFEPLLGYTRKVFSETVIGHKKQVQEIKWTRFEDGSVMGKARWKVDNWMGHAEIRRKYDCAAAKDIDTGNAMDIDKAKSTCTELGFALGTEKHGDCVLKMMDN